MCQSRDPPQLPASENAAAEETANDQTTAMQTAPEASASTKVFAIPELLENILIELANATAVRHEEPAQQLYVFQRVNCTFQTTIKTSPEFQKRMWLSPMKKEECCKNDKAHSRFMPFTSLSILLNLLKLETWEPPCYNLYIGYFVYTRPEICAGSSRAMRGICETASWRDMCAFPLAGGKREPVVTWNFRVEEEVGDEEGSWKKTFSESVKLHQGLSLGNVYDEFVRRKESAGRRRRIIEDVMDAEMMEADYMEFE